MHPKHQNVPTLILGSHVIEFHQRKNPTTSEPR